VLDDLRALRRSHQKLGRRGCGTGASQRAWLSIVLPRSAFVYSPEYFGGALGVAANDNTIRMQKVNDSRTFAQELGIRDYIEAVRVHAVPVKHASNPLVGIDRNSALLNDDLVAIDDAGNPRNDCLNIGEVGGSSIPLRCATAMKMASLRSTASPKSEVKVTPWSRCFARSSGRCCS